MRMTPVIHYRFDLRRFSLYAYAAMMIIFVLIFDIISSRYVDRCRLSSAAAIFAIISFLRCPPRHADVC